MATILLTSENLDFVKPALRSSIPTIKSSHFAEAFAASLGLRTHAALLAQFRFSSARPPLMKADEARFSARLSELSGTTHGVGALSSILRAPSMPTRIWVEFAEGDRYANDRWYYECRRRIIPNIFVTKRRKYADLHWDCISLDHGTEGHVRNKAGDALAKVMYDRYCEIVGPDGKKSVFNGSAFVGEVERLLPSKAYELADAFAVMLYGPTVVTTAA